VNPDWEGAENWREFMQPVLEYLQHQHRLSGIDILGWGVITTDPPMAYVRTPRGFTVPDVIAGIMILHEVVS
jgi:hypothetical protein